MLVFIRITAALAVLPIYGRRAVPSSVKAALGVAIAILVAPSVPPHMMEKTGTIADYLIIGLNETLCGALIGFAGQLLFFAVEICGRILGLQSGLSIVSSIDPHSDMQSDILTQFYDMLAVLVFLSIDGHLMLLKALRASFDTVSIGAMSLDGKLAEWSIAQAGEILGQGVQLAAPMMVTLFLCDVALGILTRVAPTMNVFVLGFPLKIGITLVFAALTTGTIAQIFAHHSILRIQGVSELLKVLAGS